MWALLVFVLDRPSEDCLGEPLKHSWQSPMILGRQWLVWLLAPDCETNTEAEREPGGASESGRRVRPGQLRAMATCTCYSDGRSPHPRQGNFTHPHHLELQLHVTPVPYLPEPPRVCVAVGGHWQGLGVVRVTGWVVVRGCEGQIWVESLSVSLQRDS